MLGFEPGKEGIEMFANHTPCLVDFSVPCTGDLAGISHFRQTGQHLPP